MRFPKDILAALGAAPAIRYEGYAFRVVPGGVLVRNLKFEHLMAGSGPGRCNPSGVVRLYLAVEKSTAQAEFLHYAATGGLNPDLADSYAFAAKVSLSRVLDLTDKETRQIVGITNSQIQMDWEADPLLPTPTFTRLQEIGGWVAKGAGNFSAILYSSKRRVKGRNLAIFPARMDPRSSIVPLSATPTKSLP